MTSVFKEIVDKQTKEAKHPLHEKATNVKFAPYSIREEGGSSTAQDEHKQQEDKPQK